MIKVLSIHPALVTGIIVLCACSKPQKEAEHTQNIKQEKVLTGAERLDLYLPLLNNKKVGLLVNHTSQIRGVHLLDTLLALNITVKKIFTPEHGFRGNADAGEPIDNAADAKTGIPLISVYGQRKKPNPKDLKDTDIIIFDSQDVGARFFTYLSAMQYMMEACAENHIQMLILDRPNPNAGYVDGPVLNMKHQSYVGMNPIPIVFGLTAGELAKMIVGEGWINAAQELDLKIIKAAGWDHSKPYTLPVKPSPNLPTAQSIALYPSLCLFEGTNVSVGRGTETPFQVIGAPDSTFGNYSFIPRSIEGMSKHPKYEGIKCYGYDLSRAAVPRRLNLSYLIAFYNKSENKDKFFNKYFVKLAGTERLQKQIEQGISEEAIRASWEEDLNKYKKIRRKYLLYKDFE